MSTDPPLPLDALLAAAGVEPTSGVQICGPEGVAALDPTRPALVLLPHPLPPTEAFRHYPADLAVTLLIPDPSGALRTRGTTLAQVRLEPGGMGPAVALTLAAAPTADVAFAVEGLRGVIARLRDPDGGCPWDLAQDHRSLRPHLLEEAYEVLGALDRGDPAALREELGDLLMQIVLHAQVAQDQQAFDLDDVAEGIRAKLIRRHPHVFGGAAADGVEMAYQRWDQMKAEERRPDASALDGVPAALPSLARAHSLLGRADRKGFAWPSANAVIDKLAEEVREWRTAGEATAAEEFGDLLLGLVDIARRRGLHAEDALREAAARFEHRFRALEAGLRTDGLDFAGVSPAELLARWARVKAAASG